MFCSKRAFNALSSSSRCSGDKSFLLLLMFRALVALIVVASRVFYLLLRCAPPHGFFSACLCVLINSQSPRRSDCTRQYILARRRQPNMRVSHFSPAARNRQENLGRLLHKRRLLLQRKHQISVPPCLPGQRSKFLASYTKSRQSCVGVLFHPSRLSAILRKSAVVIGRLPYVRKYLTTIGWHVSTAPAELRPERAFPRLLPNCRPQGQFAQR